ncbi:MAG: TnsD family transposase [Anaerolineae bacterium]|nr:TnsD family transposase [Anaerolineae bacterium]
MLSHFPHPYPDELLYSVIARYSARMQYSIGRAVVEELFNSSKVVAVIDLPSNLDRLLVNMPIGHRYTANWLINHCTLLPFYAPFLPPDRLQLIRQDMQGKNGPGIQMRMGLMASTVPYPQWLRFCPQCIAEDRSKFIETYWHRLHQISGVDVCTKHRVFLENSPFRARSAGTRYLFAAAEAVEPIQLPRPVNERIRVHQILFQLATEIAWLLEQPVITIDQNNHRDRYLKLLAERGLATYTGQIRLTKLVDSFNQFYSERFLGELHCSVSSSSGDNWLARLIRQPNKAQHPLHHLLLVQFLGYTLREFFDVATQPIYFGIGPWPCLNPTCKFFRQVAINTCQIRFSADSRRPVGTFACECGFTYIRLGPDKTIEDRYRFSRVVSYGPVWENRLCQMWPDVEISLRGVARQLGVDPRTANRHAVRLGLPFPRPGHRNGKNPVITEKKNSPRSNETRSMHRQRWLTLLDEHPEYSLNDLRAQCKAAYSWLYRYDKRWLDQHKPPTKASKVPMATRVDWAKRDVFLVGACLKAALHLAQRSGKPKQLTQTAIIREAGCYAVVFQHPEKLPITTDILSQLAESRQDYALRRIEWIATRACDGGDALKKWQLIRFSGTARVKEWGEIEQALELFTKWLQKSAMQPGNNRPPLEVSRKLLNKISELFDRLRNNENLN